MRRLVDLPSSRLHKERSRLELGMAFSLTQHNFFDEKKMWAEPARLMGVDATLPPPPPPIRFFWVDKTSVPDVFISCSFILAHILRQV